MLHVSHWIPGPPVARLVALLTVASLSRCTPGPAQPPKAEKRTHWVESPHGKRLDEYYWLRDDRREDRDVLAYLEAENAWADHVLEPVKDLQGALEQEMVQRLEPNMDTAPVRRGDFDYFSRYREGEQYPVHLRRGVAPGSVEEVVLDERARAEGRDFYSLAGYAVSPDGTRVAFAEDPVGRRLYTVRVLDISRGELLPDELPGTTGNIAWDAAGEHLLYVSRDPGTLLGRTAKLHRLGQPVRKDRLVYEEDDRSFYMRVGRTPDDAFLTITLRSTTTSEVRFLPADQPAAPVRRLAPREPGLKYSVSHLEGRWIIHTDWNAPDYRLMTVDDPDAGSRDRWRSLYQPAPGTFLQGMAVTNTHLVTLERLRGVARVRLRAWTGGEDRIVEPSAPASVIQLEPLPDPGVTSVRVRESSLIEPARVDEVSLHSGRRRTLWQQPLRGHDPSRYFTARIQARTGDRVRIPVTIAHRKGLRRDGKAPMVIYGYGAYGSILEPTFRDHVISLLDRGVVFAMAHVRGGQELGRDWYEQGRLLEKSNSFSDFIQATGALIRLGVASRERICAAGGSAGGLLVGAVINKRPDLYRAAVAQVPFVDVVTTMLDESIPLTTNEYDEWGDPRKKPFYDAMLAYSPYDNIDPTQWYPAMYVTTGLWDSQVQYWEPAKWVARLRDRKPDRRRLVLRTNMSAGHGGASGRLARYGERAEEYAFVLRELGVAGPAE